MKNPMRVSMKLEVLWNSQISLLHSDILQTHAEVIYSPMTQQMVSPYSKGTHSYHCLRKIRAVNLNSQRVLHLTEANYIKEDFSGNMMLLWKKNKI
jgi:hypothetical protein